MTNDLFNIKSCNGTEYQKKGNLSKDQRSPGLRQKQKKYLSRDKIY